MGGTWLLEMLFLWGVSVKDFLCVSKRTVKDISVSVKHCVYVIPYLSFNTIELLLKKHYQYRFNLVIIVIVESFGCTAIHNKVLYKCIIHSFYFSLIILYICIL